jgi:hypothetical protein
MKPGNESENKESWPRGIGFDFTPKGFCLPIEAEWNVGMVEKWKDGYLKLSAIFFIKDLLPLDPIFHLSSFPIPQDILLWQSPLSLTWPRGPGFRC